MIRHPLHALIISTVLLLQAPTVIAADKVDVRAGEHPKYGRIVLGLGAEGCAYSCN